MDDYGEPHTRGRWGHAALIDVTSGYWNFHSFLLLSIYFEVLSYTCEYFTLMMTLCVLNSVVALIII